MYTYCTIAVLLITVLPQHTARGESRFNDAMLACLVSSACRNDVTHVLACMLLLKLTYIIAQIMAHVDILQQVHSIKD